MEEGPYPGEPVYAGVREEVITPRQASSRFLACVLLSPGLFIPGLCRFLPSDYPAERTISSSTVQPQMPGARGIVTAFARILVSEPCRPLDAIAMPALAADNPSSDLPAIHPVLTCHSRGKGPLFKACSMLHSVYRVRTPGATFDPLGRQTGTESIPRRKNTR